MHFEFYILTCLLSGEWHIKGKYQKNNVDCKVNCHQNIINQCILLIHL